MPTFREQLLREGLAPRTASTYANYAWAADQWCQARGFALKTVPADVLIEYVNQQPKSWATRKALRVTFAHYWRIERRRKPPLWVVRVPKKPKMRCRALTDKQAATLARAARRAGGLPGLAVALGLYMALRRSEIATMRWDDVDADGWLHLVGKGDVSAQLPMHPRVLRAMVGLDRVGPFVFPGRIDGHAHPATIWHWIRTLAVEAGLGPVTTHQLRHTCLAVANDVTGDLRAVQELARHSRPETTAGYTRTTAARLTWVIECVEYERDEGPGPQEGVAKPA